MSVATFLQLEMYQLVLLAVAGVSILPVSFFLLELHPRVRAVLEDRSIMVEPAIIGPVGLLFGLFAAFLANDIWGTNVTARTAILQEVDGIQAMMRFSEGLAEAEAKMMRNALTAYVKNALENEWPKMAQGEADAQAPNRIKAISTAIITFEVGKSEGPVIQGRLLDAFNQIRQNWQVRTRIAQDRKLTIKWQGVLLFGLLTQIAIAVAHLSRPRAMLIAQGVFGIAFALMMVLLFTNEFPFTSLAPISPAPLEQVYELLKAK